MNSTKSAKKPNNKGEEFGPEQVKARLDAIVLLLCASNFSDEKGNLERKPVAKLLHKAGYKPTEIAHVFGKKKATDVSSYLY